MRPPQFRLVFGTESQAEPESKGEALGHVDKLIPNGGLLVSVLIRAPLFSSFCACLAIALRATAGDSSNREGAGVRQAFFRVFQFSCFRDGFSGFHSVY